MRFYPYHRSFPPHPALSGSPLAFWLYSLTPNTSPLVPMLDTIIQGVLLGGLYALYATGLSLIFGIMRLVNLAHGDLIVLAAFLILALSRALALDSVLAFAIAMPVMFAVGYGLQAFLLNRTLGLDILPPLLVTFGLSIVIQNGLLQTFSADSQRLQVGG